MEWEYDNIRGHVVVINWIFIDMIVSAIQNIVKTENEKTENYYQCLALKVAGINILDIVVKNV